MKETLNEVVIEGKFCNPIVIDPKASEFNDVAMLEALPTLLILPRIYL